jgi:hypothetical protein
MKTAFTLLKTKALADLDAYCKRRKPSELDETARELDSIAIQAVRMAAYLMRRSGDGCGDDGHAAAVKHQNKQAAKVRKAIGFTYPKQDINF